MVPLCCIKTTACPICGCTVVVAEKVEVEMNRQEIRSHCNGGHWESRKFACGYETKYIPNFCREEKIAGCKNDPELLELERKTAELKAQIMKLIEGSDVPDYIKQRFADGIKYK